MASEANGTVDGPEPYTVIGNGAGDGFYIQYCNYVVNPHKYDSRAEAEDHAREMNRLNRIRVQGVMDIMSAVLDGRQVHFTDRRES